MAGERVCLDARVSGARPFRFQWLRDEQPVATATPAARHSLLCDETGGDLSLVIESAAPQDAGVYSLVIQNAEGSLRCDAKLEVRVPSGAPDAYVSQLLPSTCVACENSSISLACEFILPARSEGDAAPVWLRDGLPVEQHVGHISVSNR